MKKQPKKNQSHKVVAVWEAPPDLKKMALALNQLYIATNKG
ncbi:hypothetical protein V7166_23365 [Bacillus thuringiensis]